MNNCTYKKCLNLTNIQRKNIKNRYICDQCYELIREKTRDRESKMKKSVEYKEKNSKKIKEQKRNSYHRLKKDPLWNEKYKKRSREASFKRNQTGTVKRRLQILKNSLYYKKEICDITESQLSDIINNQHCYISGIKLSIVAENQRQSCFLDRIGKLEHGGDGIKGGNYTIKNIRPAIFAFNQSREQMGLTDKEIEKLFEPIRNSSDPKILAILEKIQNKDSSSDLDIKNTTILDLNDSEDKF